jgi:hypothetical protein
MPQEPREELAVRRVSSLFDFLMLREQTQAMRNLGFDQNIENCLHSSYTAIVIPIYDSNIRWL